jgi:hypothetical protein
MKSRLMPALLLLATVSLAHGEEAGSKNATQKIDAAIQEVIQQREYQWRLPREVVDEDEQGLLFEFFEGVMNTAKRMWKPIVELWNKINTWLRRQLSSLGPQGSGREWTAGEMNLLIVTLVVILALLIVFFIWRNRKSKISTASIAAEPVQSVPDLNNEDVVADQLPEEGWQRLAQDLLSRGELRLALRAMFMATLAHLARTRFITIARFKSNQDYQREFRRRVTERPELQNAFGETVRTIDSVWYGMYPVTNEVLQRFKENADFVIRDAV